LYFGYLNFLTMDFTLRAFTANDIHSLAKYANNINVSRYLMDGFPHPYTVGHAIKFIEMASGMKPVSIFTIDVNGEASGGIGIHPQNDIMKKNAELGYWLAEPYWGNGIMSRAIMLMVDFGFKTFDITRIYARPFSNNPASQHILEKCGFKLEARIEKNIFKNGEFLDELIYAIRK
jgi:ribosomal-protein-alanine N-acetyltransferase